MTTDKQNRTKMALLADQLRRHCKSKGLQCFLFSEGDTEGTNAVSGYFSDKMIASLVQHLYMWKPQLIRDAMKAVDELATPEAPKEEEKKPSLIITP